MSTLANTIARASKGRPKGTFTIPRDRDQDIYVLVQSELTRSRRTNRRISEIQVCQKIIDRFGSLAWVNSVAEEPIGNNLPRVRLEPFHTIRSAASLRSRYCEAKAFAQRNPHNKMAWDNIVADRLGIPRPYTANQLIETSRSVR